MNFSQAITSGFKNYATFSGRATRSEFWYWTLFIIIGTWVSYFLDRAIFHIDFSDSHAVPPIGTIFELVILLPGLAVTARRLHDVDINGWWQLIMLLPVLGWILFLIWTCRKGTEGENRFDSHYISLSNRVFATILILFIPTFGLYTLLSERSIIAEHDTVVDTGSYKALIPEGFRYSITNTPHAGVMLEAIRKNENSHIEYSILSLSPTTLDKVIEKEKEVTLRQNPSSHFSEVTSATQGQFTINQMTMTLPETGSTIPLTMLMAVFSKPDKLYMMMFKTSDKDFDSYSKIYGKMVQAFVANN